MSYIGCTENVDQLEIVQVALFVGGEIVEYKGLKIKNTIKNHIYIINLESIYQYSKS